MQGSKQANSGYLLGGYKCWRTHAQASSPYCRDLGLVASSGAKGSDNTPHGSSIQGPRTWRGGSIDDSAACPKQSARRELRTRAFMDLPPHVPTPSASPDNSSPPHSPHPSPQPAPPVRQLHSPVSPTRWPCPKEGRGKQDVTVRSELARPSDPAP